jgi:hypothetical protein
MELEDGTNTVEISKEFREKLEKIVEESTRVFEGYFVKRPDDVKKAIDDEKEDEELNKSLDEDAKMIDSGLSC